MEDNSLFYSKLLLFGEYSIIKSSRALAMSYPLFSGELKFAEAELNKQSNKELRAFYSFLRSLSNDENEFLNLDLSSFEFDLEQGLSFHSSIPQGYGVGSSGALCAAIYHRYAKNPIPRVFSADLLDKLRLKLALMEGHFHSSSSGLDPLISYVSCPILIHADRSMERVNFSNISCDKEKKLTMFILDTGRSRRTEPLVNLFLEKLKNDDFNLLCERELSDITNNCISSLLGADPYSLFESFEALSRFQLTHFGPMIPKLYRAPWENGLQDKDFYLKLCGAGGGGFILGIAKNFEKFLKDRPKEKIRPILTF